VISCCQCGEPLPESTTYMEAVQLESEMLKGWWRYLCETCLADIAEPYEVRLDWEIRTLAWRTASGHA